MDLPARVRRRTATPARRPRVRRRRRVRHDHAQRDDARPCREPAPDVPVRRLRVARSLRATNWSSPSMPRRRTPRRCATRIGDLPNPYGTPFNFVRKMACNFGWDWGPQLTTSGLWRPVALERWEAVRIHAVRPTPRLVTDDAPVHGESGRLDVIVDLDVDLGTAPGPSPSCRRPSRHQAATSSGAARSCRSPAGAPSSASTCPTSSGGGRPATASSRCTGSTSRSPAHDAAHDRTTTTVGFRTVRLDTSELTRRAQRSPSTSTASGSGSAASTGSLPTASRRATPASSSPACSARRRRPTPTSSASGEAACTRATGSTTSATAVGYSCGRTSRSPAPPTPRRCSATRSPPRPPTTSPA